jgi:hypothetical protein
MVKNRVLLKDVEPEKVIQIMFSEESHPSLRESIWIMILRQLTFQYSQF